MKLTLGTIKKFTRRAMRDNNIRGTIVSAEWLGKRCAVTRRLGRCEYTEYFRTARVVIEVPDGRRVAKHATLDSNHAFRIC
jgi:hypothetical protein